MNIQKNWWELTSCGSRFCDDVILALESSKSVALIGRRLPWVETFYEKLKGESISASKAFETINGTGITQPGEYLFNKYCPPEIQSNYWPNPPLYSHVNFLAETDDIIINHRFVIVRNFESEKTFFCWCDFVEKYNRCIDAANIPREDRAVFILECEGVKSAASRLSAIQTLTHEPREFDMFTYNLVNTSNKYSGYLVNKYAAELISELCGNDVEQCGLLSNFDDLIKNPTKTYSLFAQTLSGKSSLSIEQTNSAVLSAQFKIFFPLIEQKRRELIDKYYDAITFCLPWQNDFNENKIEPYDMELRDLIFKFGEIEISEIDRKTIRVLRYARNQLAHNHVLTYDEILSFVDTN